MDPNIFFLRASVVLPQKYRFCETSAADTVQVCRNMSSASKKVFSVCTNFGIAVHKTSIGGNSDDTSAQKKQKQKLHPTSSRVAESSESELCFYLPFRQILRNQSRLKKQGGESIKHWMTTKKKKKKPLFGDICRLSRWVPHLNILPLTSKWKSFLAVMFQTLCRRRWSQCCGQLFMQYPKATNKKETAWCQTSQYLPPPRHAAFIHMPTPPCLVAPTFSLL